MNYNFLLVLLFVFSQCSWGLLFLFTNVNLYVVKFSHHFFDDFWVSCHSLKDLFHSKLCFKNHQTTKVCHKIKFYATVKNNKSICTISEIGPLYVKLLKKSLPVLFYLSLTTFYKFGVVISLILLTRTLSYRDVKYLWTCL